MAAEYLESQDFHRVATIDVERGRDGQPLRYDPQRELPTKERHVKATGPFGRLTLPTLPELPGVYVVVIDGHAVYVGVTVTSLAQRWRHYAWITPSACKRDGGQPTNCRINQEVMKARQSGARVALWFREDRTLERVTIDALQPPWNER